MSLYFQDFVLSVVCTYVCYYFQDRLYFQEFVLSRLCSLRSLNFKEFVLTEVCTFRSVYLQELSCKFSQFIFPEFVTLMIWSQNMTIKKTPLRSSLISDR